MASDASGERLALASASSSVSQRRAATVILALHVGPQVARPDRGVQRARRVQDDGRALDGVDAGR
jgi:hypothetical protein